MPRHFPCRARGASGPALNGRRGIHRRFVPPASYRRTMADLSRRLAVARGDEPADLVIRGGRVFSAFTREWLDAEVAIVDGFVAGLGDYEGREILDATGRYVVPGLRRRAPPPRVVEAARRRVRPARAAARHDGGRGRPARDRERARHRRRALAPRRLCRAAARGLLHGLVVRAGLVVRVAAPGADDRRPRGAAAPAPRARPRRDDELPRASSPAPSTSWRSSPSPAMSTATRPGVLGKQLNAYAAAGIRSDHEAFTARGGPRAAARRHVAADPGGLGSAQPERADPARARVRAVADRVLHRRPRARAHRRRRARQLDRARRGRARRPARGRARDGVAESGRTTTGSATWGRSPPATRRTCSSSPTSSRSCRSSF